MVVASMTPNQFIIRDREQNWHQRDAIHRLYQSGHLDAPAYLRRLRELDNPPAELQWVVPIALLGIIGAFVLMAVSRG